MIDYLSLLLADLIDESHSHHIALEVLLILWVLWLISKKNKKDNLNLTESEKEALIRDFEPEPLVPEVSPSSPALNPPILSGKAKKEVTVNGKLRLNFATHNYLGFIGSETIEASAIRSIEHYGVGSCGPRGFYGTTELHLQLEQRLAEFMGTEDAIVYAYAFSTVASAIPAYAKRGDIIFVDEKANFAIQKGLDASRSVIKYFKHNDVDDLEKILKKTREEDLKNPKKAQRSRRFLVVEGIYANTGLLCPLPKLLELRDRFKFRIFVDETISFGVLGAHGKGITEHYNVAVSEVDLIMGSLEHALGSIGGFCVGTSFIVDHQRLSGLGYCFSASLPPPQVAAAIAALDVLDQHPDMVDGLKQNCNKLYDMLNTSTILSKLFTISGDKHSPIHMLKLRPNPNDPESHEPMLLMNVLLKIVSESGYALSPVMYLEGLDHAFPEGVPILRVVVSSLHSEEEITGFVNSLEKAVNSIATEYYD